MHSVILPIPNLLCTTAPLKLPLSVSFIQDLVSLVCITTRILFNSMSMFLAMLLIPTLQMMSTCLDRQTLSMFIPVSKPTSVLSTVSLYHFAITMLQAVEPLPNVCLAIRKCELTMALLFAVG